MARPVRTVSAWTYRTTPVYRARVWGERDLPRAGERLTWEWHVVLLRDGQSWQYLGSYRYWDTAVDQACNALEHITRGDDALSAVEYVRRGAT